MRRVYFTLAFALVALLASAAAPNSSGTYYSAANGKKGSALKTALCRILYDTRNNPPLSYKALWDAFYTTDVCDGDKVWDMYSNKTKLTLGTNQDSGSGNAEGQYYNREHSFPASWFGEGTPMYTDLHHIYPTDKFVNNKRSNYPFGTTNGEDYKSANSFSKLGSCTYPGYTGTVFEPNDMYKGDFARTYFYMVTCYEEQLSSWVTNYSSTDVVNVLDGNAYPGLKTWQLNMLLAWAAADPVSEKEINRNNEVKKLQGNRNPFIDYPGLEQYIWGNKVNDTFSYDNYVVPPGHEAQSGGNRTYKLQQVTSVEAGGMYVFEQDGYVMNNTCSSSALQTTNTYNTTGLTGTETYVWTLETATNGYYMKNVNGTNSSPYLNNTSSTNVSFGNNKSSIWAFNFQEDGTVVIQSNNYRFLGYTSTTSHAYKAYDKSNLSSSSYPHAIKVYQLVEETSSLNPSDLALTGAPIALNFDLYNSAAQTVSYTTSSTGAVTVSSSQYVTTSVNQDTKTITVTPVAKTSSPQTITVSQAADGTYEAGEVTFTVTVDDSTPGPVSEGTWVETSLASLTSSDVFVIVGTNSNGSYAMTNDNGTSAAPAASAVTISEGKITSDVADNLKWNISGNATNGYVFYLNGNTSSWLYCNSDNDGVRVGTNTNKYFTIKNGYLYNNATSRYLGIFAYRQWRCYTSINDNIKNQAFAFYKYVAPSHQIVTVSEVGYATYCSEYALDFGGTEITAYVGTLEGTALTFTPITQVPANTGLLLVAEGGKTADVPVIASAPALSETNCLTGVNVATTLNEDDYILNVVSGRAGFYKAGEFTALGAHKAYIPAVTGNGVKSFAICLEDDPTSIQTIDNRQRTTDDAIFNLAGQRIQKLQKGINIVNGKKILK